MANGKAELTQQLAPIFRRWGFVRVGADWILERDEIRVLAFISIVRSPEGDEYDLSCTVYASEPLWARDDEESTGGRVLTSFAVGDLEGSRVDPRSSRYGGAASHTVEWLAGDTEATLGPLIARLSTIGDVVSAQIDGLLGPKQVARVTQIVDGWRLARDFGLRGESERALGLLRAGTWSGPDRDALEYAISKIGVPVALPPNPNEPSWRAFFRRKAR